MARPQPELKTILVTMVILWTRHLSDAKIVNLFCTQKNERLIAGREESIIEETKRLITFSLKNGILDTRKDKKNEYNSRRWIK